MLVKDLIKALQACDPNTDVEATVERCEGVRMSIAKKCVEKGNADILSRLEVDGVRLEQGIQGDDENTISCFILLKVLSHV